MVEITELVVNGDDHADRRCSNGFTAYPGSSLPSSSKTSPICTRRDDSSLLREELLKEIHSGEGLLSEQLPGGAPSLAESESALRELQSILAQKSVDTSADEFIEKSRMTDSASRKRKKSRGGDNNVIHRSAHLLRHDPKLQAAVVSLARDPAIWDACSKNQKFQELVYGMNSGYSPLDANHRTGTLLLQERGNPFVMALQCVKNFLHDIIDTVNGAFGFIDRWLFGEPGEPGEPDGNFLDRSLKTGIVLTMLLLALVVLRRKL